MKLEADGTSEFYVSLTKKKDTILLDETSA